MNNKLVACFILFRHRNDWYRCQVAMSQMFGNRWKYKQVFQFNSVLMASPSMSSCQKQLGKMQFWEPFGSSYQSKQMKSLCKCYPSNFFFFLLLMWDLKLNFNHTLIFKGYICELRMFRKFIANFTRFGDRQELSSTWIRL